MALTSTLPPNPTGADLVRAIGEAQAGASTALNIIRDNESLFPSADKRAEAFGQISGALAALAAVRDRCTPETWQLPQSALADEYRRAAQQLAAGIALASSELGENRKGLGSIYVPGVGMGDLADRMRDLGDRMNRALGLAFDWRIWAAVGGVVLLLLVLAIVSAFRR